MIHTYKANSLLSIKIIVNEQSLRITFQPDVTGSIYTTSNTDVVVALENHTLFNDVFFKIPDKRDKIHIDTKDEKGVGEKLVQVDNIDNCPDAITYLQEHGFSGNIKTKKDITSAAKSIGIIFSNLK